MILILPLLFTWIFYVIKDNDSIIVKYGVLSILIYNLNVSIGYDIYKLIIIYIILYWILLENNILFGILISISIIFIYSANSIYGLFVSIELISFIAITFINLYIQDKLPGILYYLFSSLFTGLFILSLGYLYLGYTYTYSLLIFVFIWKLGLGPLHILTPYIYNNLSPRKILFIDVISKYPLFYIFYRLMISINISINYILLISIILGSLLAININNLINLLIYSSLLNYGLILLLISNYNLFYIYLIYYILSVVVYLYLITHYYIFYSFNNLYYRLIWSLLLFNLIGIPPLNGFWIKLLALINLVYNLNFIFLIIILLSLLIISFVYIRILIKIILLSQSNKTIKLYNNNLFNSHFISSLVIILNFPILFI